MSNLADKTRSRVQTSPSGGGEAQLLAIWPQGSNRVALPAIGVVTAGRGAECALRIVDASVSRAHVRIHVSEKGVRLEDLGSSNGTWVAGVKVQAHTLVPLVPGALVELGDAILMVQGPSGAAALATTPTLLGADAAAPTAAGAMARTVKLAHIVATSDLNVILQGETGVGKEVLAREIHDKSPRRTGPFLKVNCAAFAESMVESELFGHDKGAFTGAASAKPGLIEAASGGTLLLDEVAELSAGMQAKLLRAVGNLEVIRMGSVSPKTIDVRFIAASHEPINNLISRDRFRPDLFYRLNGVTLTIPPLRERQDEIAQLASSFVQAWSAKNNRGPLALSQDGVAWLRSQAWPGNVRELKATVERAALLAEGRVLGREQFMDAADLAGNAPLPPLGLHSPHAAAAQQLGSGPTSAATGLKDELSRLERDRIVEAIAHCAGNQTKAAARLGMSRRALLHKLDAYSLPRPRKGTADTE